MSILKIASAQNRARFIKLPLDGNRYLFSDMIKEAAKTAEQYLLFDCEYAPDLHDIYNVTRIQDLQESRMSKLAKIRIRNTTGVSEEIEINDDKRLPFLTCEFLEHIKEVGFSVDDELSSFVIPLKGWKWATPFAKLPLPDFDMSKSDSNNKKG